MLEDVKISKALYKDLDGILCLQKSAFRSEAEFYKDFNIEPLTQTLDSIEKDFTHFLFLKAEFNDTIVGCVKARETGKFCWIGRLIVDPEYQNMGIGRQLMIEIEKAFPRTKLYLLCTGYESSTNIKFYESMGYNRKDLFSDKQNSFLLVKMIKSNVKN